jgi:hypothetical protein
MGGAIERSHPPGGPQRMTSSAWKRSVGGCLVDLGDATLGVARTHLATRDEMPSDGSAGAIGSTMGNDIFWAHLPWRGRSHLSGPARGHTRKAIAMHKRHASTGKQLKWLGMLGLLTALLLVSAVPGDARVSVFIGARRRGSLWAVLGPLLGALCLSLCVPAGRGRAPSPGLCPTRTTGRCPASSPVIVVLLRPSARLLSVCATVPRRMEAGPREAAIDALWGGLADDLVGLEEEG